MKFVPLVWAALWRSRTETALTLLALTVAFTLFGTMVALNTAYERAIHASPLNRLFMFCRFDCPDQLPLAYRDQIARIPGVVAIGALATLQGYYQDPSKKLGVQFVDENYKAAWPELTIDDAQWKTLQASRTGVYFTRSAAIRWGVKAGDTFTVIGAPDSRVDGAPAWTLDVLGVVEDTPDWGQGPPDQIYGNFEYFEQSQPAARRGHARMYRISVADPSKARATCHQIDAMYINSSVPTFCVPTRDDAEQLADSNLNMRQISLGIAGAGLFMILFLCANGVAESVRERLAQFGMLKTLGYSDRKVATIVLLEAALPTLLGALLGTGLAWLIGMQITRLSEEGKLRLPHVPLPIGVFATALALALLIASLSAIAPLQRLKRMDLAAVMARR